MNPEIALPDETVELCNTAITIYANFLQHHEEVGRDEFYRAEHAAVIACNALATVRETGWYSVLKQECATRGVELRPRTPIQKRRMRRTAYAAVGSDRSFDPTPDNAIRAYLPELTSEE